MNVRVVRTFSSVQWLKNHSLLPRYLSGFELSQVLTSMKANEYVRLSRDWRA